MSPADIRRALLAAFSARPPRGCPDERALCDVLERELTAVADAYDLPVLREHRLTAADRLDFLFGSGGILGEGVAVEVKVKGSLGDLTRQLFRYAEDPRVSGLLVVTTRAQHRGLPEAIRGKPVACLWLGGFLL